MPTVKKELPSVKVLAAILVSEYRVEQSTEASNNFYVPMMTSLGQACYGADSIQPNLRGTSSALKGQL